MEFNRENNQYRLNRIEELYSLFLSHPCVSTDTRAICKGNIFFALQGDNFNGNQFAQKALDAGAALAVVDQKEYCTSKNCFLVDNVLTTLQFLATYHRRQMKDIKVLAITGTNGKTTTKELTAAVLATKYNVLATQGNLNNQIGVPLTLLRITPQTQIAIIEMGASHPRDIAELCFIAEPDYGLITNVGRAHIAGFGSFENIVKTKTELFRYLEGREGLCFVNMDDSNLAPWIDKLDCKIVPFSIMNPQEGVMASVWFDGQIVRSNLLGSYNAHNMLAAIVIGLLFKVDTTKAKEAIEAYQPSNNRSQIQKTAKNTLILDCYNANPSSFEAVFADFKAIEAENKMAFIGAMKELGDVSIQEHKKVLQQLKDLNLKKIILVGDEFKEGITLEDDMLWFSSSTQVKDYLTQNPVSGATILIKGSNSTKMIVLADVL